MAEPELGEGEAAPSDASAALTAAGRVRASGLFDLAHYLVQRPEAPRDLTAAITDYLVTGWLEGTDPGPGFSTRYYLAVNDDVRDEGCNPLLHYIDYGKVEGRRPRPRASTSASVRTPPPTVPTDAEWRGLNSARPRQAPLVDVLVPIYTGRAETLRCLYSVLAEPQRTPFAVAVINDASPDEELADALRALADRGFFELHERPRNEGFVAACNYGMALHPDRDVVLLNSDTQVFGDWLDRLRASAIRSPQTATATPFSNNAEICSYPAFCEDNWRQLETEDRELDRLAATTNAGVSVEIPTGVGFCLYIRRACLNQIGIFDEGSFGRGYGEENDLCRRAARAGWRNILAADVFVRHYGGVSFGESKVRRLKAALNTLERLHPGYQKLVGAFVAADPVRPWREALDIARLRSRAGRGAFLFVTHTWGGGTERHVRELATQLEEEGVPVFFCREVEGDPSLIRIEDPGTSETVNLQSFDLARDVEAFADLLSRIGVRHVHVHNLAAMDPVAADFMRNAARLADLAYDVTLHDYLPICPRIDLVDRSGVYCGEPPVTVCEHCIARDGSRFGKPPVWHWRERWTRFLEGARRVFVPDTDVALRMSLHMPGVDFCVRPHAYSSTSQAVSHRPRTGRGRQMRRVAIIGAIGPSKGSVLLVQTARAARALGLPLAFTVVGYTDRDAELEAIGNVTITGPYAEADALAHVQDAEADLAWFPAVWPETFSYTLSITLDAGLFPVVFALGAPARRLAELEWGAVWPMREMLEPSRLAQRLLRQKIKRPFPNLGTGVVVREYRDLLTSYYELDEAARLLGPGPATALGVGAAS